MLVAEKLSTNSNENSYQEQLVYLECSLLSCGGIVEDKQDYTFWLIVTRQGNKNPRRNKLLHLGKLLPYAIAFYFPVVHP